MSASSQQDVQAFRPEAHRAKEHISIITSAGKTDQWETVREAEVVRRGREGRAKT